MSTSTDITPIYAAALAAAAEPEPTVTVVAYTPTTTSPYAPLVESALVRAMRRSGKFSL